MWASAGSIVLGLTVAMVAAAPGTDTISEAVMANQQSIAQLSEAVSNMVAADGEIKQRLTEATNALIDSQSTLQQVLNGPGGKGQGGGFGGSEDMMRQFANQVATTLQDLSFRYTGVEGGNRTYSKYDSKGNHTTATSGSVLQDILNELKSLNSHFKRHFASLSCPPPFVMLGSDCYNVILEDLSWADARNKCLSMGADLAQPSNITELKVYVGHRYPRKGRRNFWIGGVYREKIWQWLSGDLLEEGYWHTNEPSGNGECLALFDGWENPFTDFPCENERRSICKRELF